MDTRNNRFLCAVDCPFTDQLRKTGEPARPFFAWDFFYFEQSSFCCRTAHQGNAFPTALSVGAASGHVFMVSSKGAIYRIKQRLLLCVLPFIVLGTRSTIVICR